MSHIGKILFGLVLTAVGIAVGMVLANPPAPATEAAEGEGATAAAGDTVLPPQTLKSMGVEVGPVTRQDFVRHRKVQAVVVDRPLNRRPLTAALGGIVTQIHVQTGHVVEAGALLLTMARDPIPRPRADLGCWKPSTSSAISPPRPRNGKRSGAVAEASTTIGRSVAHSLPLSVAVSRGREAAAWERPG